jgi:tetratricopeptide (TPR) repeat protein
MAIDVAFILKLAPLAIQELRRYRRGNLSRSLDRRVQAELESDPQLGPGVTDALLNEWLYIHNDPRGAIVIAGLLREGDVAYLDALRIRATELLAGLETLPIEVSDAVDRIVKAVGNNFVAAQKGEMDAAQSAASAILSAVEPLATKQDLDDALVRFERTLTPPAPRVVMLAGSFDETQRRLLHQLIAKDPSAAARLGEVLDTRGATGLAEVVRSPPPWAAELPAAFWHTSGRILSDGGWLAEAEQAFLREADRPDADDRAGALINAARCAEVDDRLDAREAADRHLATAEKVDRDHPMVRLFVADREKDPAERLAATDHVTVSDDAQIARKETQRAFALLALRRYEDAQAAAKASIAAAPHGGGREVATLVTILEAHSRLPLRARDDRPLMDAVAYQLSLHHEAGETGRTAMAGLAGARAALGTAVLGDQAAARELISRITDDAALLVHSETRSMLIEAALTTGDAESARALLDKPDGTQESRLMHATIAVLAGEDRAAAAGELDALIAEAEPGDLRRQAVVMRILAAEDPTVTLDPSIADGIEHADRLIARIRAARALAEDDVTAARAAVATFDDPSSLSVRVEIAERARALPEAIGLQAALTRRQPTAANLLHLATLRARAGDFRGAIRDALRLGTDDRKLRSARDQAYRLAADAAIEGGEFEELEDLTERWAELSPERQDPLWAHTFALARQNRHQEALAFARDAGLDAVQEANRHVLWAELLMYGAADGPERMRGLMELSDRFGRPLELERAFIGGVLKTPEPERGHDDPEVISRFQEALATFEERFPDAGGFKKVQVDADEDPAVLIEKLKAVQEPDTQQQADARQDAIDGVRQGRLPLAYLAAMVGRGTVEILVRNMAHPLAVFDRATFEAEVTAAGQALDHAGASWDETACVTVAELPPEVAKRIESLLPDSRIGQAVRNALAEAVQLQMGGEQVAVMQVLPDGTPRLVEEDPETIKRMRALERAADAVAARLTVSPDRSEDPDDKLGALVADHERRGPMAALASAMLTARSHGLPVFSDDRVVRAFARSLGLPAFGSVALVEAARGRGLIDPADAEKIMHAILDLGVWGAALDPDVYVDVARRAGFDPDRCGRPLLADEALLRVDPRFIQNGRLLAAIAREAPALLERWASTIVAGYVEILEIEPMMSSSLLIASQLDPDAAEVNDEVRARNARVVAALRDAAGHEPGRPDSDPLEAGIVRWLRVVPDADQRAATLERLLAQIASEDAEVLRRRLA